MRLQCVEIGIKTKTVNGNILIGGSYIFGIGSYRHRYSTSGEGAYLRGVVSVAGQVAKAVLLMSVTAVGVEAQKYQFGAVKSACITRNAYLKRISGITITTLKAATHAVANLLLNTTATSEQIKN